MNLLIVDDEISAIRAVANMLNYSELGINKCFTALSAEEAKVQILNNQIDILLSDIEMPRESGLDLLEWVKKEKLDISCIYMTCYAEFSYAQRAVALGSQGYLLKPLDLDELKNLLEKTIQERREREKLLRGSNILMNNDKQSIRDFWKALFYENISSERSSIEQQIRNRNLNIRPEWSYGIVLLMVRTWRTENYDGLQRFVLNNVANELFETMLSENVDWQDVMQFGERAQIAICGAEDGEKLFGLCRKFADKYTQIIPEYADVGLIAYVGKTVVIEKVAEELENLLRMDNQHLEDHGVVLYTEAENLTRLDFSIADKFGRWKQLLQGGRFEKVKQEIFDYLDDLDIHGGLNKRQFYYFHTRYLAILAEYTQEHHIVMSRLTEDTEHEKHFENAMRNLDTMKKWIDCSLKQLEEISVSDNMNLDPIQATIKYINEHLSDPLEMPEIAENVYLNQDYLTRIFKRKMGTSVKSYIVTRRMERAKELLETTSLPIVEVAYQVGYYSYTSFNRAFKKQFDESPQTFRQRTDR